MPLRQVELEGEGDSTLIYVGLLDAISAGDRELIEKHRLELRRLGHRGWLDRV
jgi:hypothetical protein